MASVLALILPALFFGPMLPLVDLIAFVGMDSYPPQLSYGPFHYATFQFTYIGHYAISRLLTDLHVAAGWQVLLLYLIQVLICFTIVYRILVRVVENVWLRAFGIVLGTLAFWNGVFLWGGPLAFSLAASSAAVGMFLVFCEADTVERNFGLPIALLLAFAILCHPFAVPFVLALCALRFAYVRRARASTVVLMAAILLAAYVIAQDSPPTEAAASGRLGLLFGFSRSQLANRFAGIWLMDAEMVRVLFGFVPLSSRVLLVMLAAMRVVGFIASPFLVFRGRVAPAMRMLAALDVTIGLMYFLAWDVPNSPIPEWPERILTWYSPFTYLAGFGACTFMGLYLAKRNRVLAAVAVRMARVAPIAGLAFVVAVQIPIFRLGRVIVANAAAVKKELIDRGLSRAFVVVSGMDDVVPFYLRSVPFLLFSDRDIVDRHIIVATEWHFQDRHPSHVIESAMNLNRKRYIADFSASDSKVSVRLIEQPEDRFPIIERTNLLRWGTPLALASSQFEQGKIFQDSGADGAALEHFNTAIYLKPDFANAWNNAAVSLFRLGKVDDSIKYFENAIKEGPKLEEARTNLAAILIAVGRPGEAISYLEESLRLRPDDSDARKLLEKANAAANPTPSVK